MPLHFTTCDELVKYIDVTWHELETIAKVNGSKELKCRVG